MIVTISVSNSAQNEQKNLEIMGHTDFFSEQTRTGSFCSFGYVCSGNVLFPPLVFTGELDKESEKKQHTRNLYRK